NYVYSNKDTFCTPGHMGGNAFTKTPLGGLFYDFYGPNIFKGDISISVTELGSLLDHSGAHLKAEKFIAKAYGSDRAYIVTNGTSTSNKIVGTFAARSHETILVDRNCHKSIAHMMIMNNVTPIYLKPSRNAYGIIGGISKSELSKESIENKIKLTKGAEKPNYCVITNSTYDGLFYNTDHLKEINVKYLHLDSAWVPYTAFHKIYDRVHGFNKDTILKDKVIFETQSTHKLLAAFSQASTINIKGNIDHKVFNEAYMMHSSTSPQYSITASTELAVAMINSKPGRTLLNDVIELSVAFRKKIKEFKNKLNKELQNPFKNSWFFDVWQPEDIIEPKCWELKPNESWHGFSNIDSDHIFLDPIKITLLTPGISASREFLEEGIPASIIAKYLDYKGIIVEKTGPYTLLFLFSIGVNKTISTQLLQALVNFKIGYDNNLTIKEFIPSLYEEDPDFYEGMLIQDLALNIHKLMKENNLIDLMYNAFEYMPKMVLNPHYAYQEELKGNTKEVSLDNLLGKVSANMILPYPPGVPMVMPGEMVTQESIYIIEFLKMLCDIGSKFPGFETDIHGVYQKNGSYFVKIIENI
ncbi:MAG: lysine decarboxylase LdcC, partial [Psittacicella sp.]